MRINFILLFACVVGCSRPAPPGPPAGSAPAPAEMAVCAKAEAPNRPVVASYWKPGTFGDETDEFLRNWFSAQLCAMGEPRLEASSDGTIRLRFLWLRTFHPGIAVRVEHTSRDTRLIAVELDGAGGYEPGGVARRLERSLSRAEWEALEQVIANSRFWTLPPSQQVIAVDGAEWIVEVAEPGRYHVVKRWSGGELELLGRHLLELSGLEPDPIY